MVDMEGNVEEVNLERDGLLNGLYRVKKHIRNTFADQQDASGYINHFGVRINMDESGNARAFSVRVQSGCRN